MTHEILGIDLSKWRENVDDEDFDKLHANGCRFLGVRVSVGLEADETAIKFIDMARARGWVTMGYHYLTAVKGDANDENGWEQGKFYGTRANMLDLDGHFLDVEDPDTSWADVIHAVEQMRANLTFTNGVGLYSRKSFFVPKFGDRPDVFDSEWWADYRGGKRWLADWETTPEQEQYRPGPLWQFTDELKWKRPSGGQRSVDGNVFTGTQLDLLRYFGGKR